MADFEDRREAQRQKVMKCIVTSIIFGIMGWIGGAMAYGAYFIPGAIIPADVIAGVGFVTAVLLTGA